MTYEISNYDLHRVNCEGPYGEWLLGLNVVCTIWVPVLSSLGDGSSHANAIRDSKLENMDFHKQWETILKVYLGVQLRIQSGNISKSFNSVLQIKWWLIQRKKRKTAK